MKTLVVALAAGVIAFGAAGQATAAPPAPDTFIVVMNADNEVPHCGPSTNAARGVAIFHVTNEAAGTVAWQLVAENLPGTITAAHIHHASAGVAGPVVQPLPPSSGDESGVIWDGDLHQPDAPRGDPRDAGRLLRQRAQHRLSEWRDPRAVRRPRAVAIAPADVHALAWR